MSHWGRHQDSGVLSWKREVHTAETLSWACLNPKISLGPIFAASSQSLQRNIDVTKWSFTQMYLVEEFVSGVEKRPALLGRTEGHVAGPGLRTDGSLEWMTASCWRRSGRLPDWAVLVPSFAFTLLREQLLPYELRMWILCLCMVSAKFSRVQWLDLAGIISGFLASRQTWDLFPCICHPGNCL